MIKLLLRKWGVIPPFAKDLKKPSNFPYYLLRIEAGIILLIALFSYFFLLEGNLFFLIIFILVPDLSLFAYAFGERVGGITFDLTHTYTLPFLIVGLAFLLNSLLIMKIGLIWFAHIAQDRLRGFGLRYTTKFNDSHLHHI